MPRANTRNLTPDEIAWRQKVGAWLKERREKVLKISQAEAARAGSLSGPFLSQLETGYADVLSIRVGHISKICAAYQIPPELFLRLINIKEAKK